jgi:hypothetical protein
VRRALGRVALAAAATVAALLLVEGALRSWPPRIA